MTIKQKLLNLVFPLGSIQRIRRGYLKGFRIRLSKNSLWSPIVGRWEPESQKLFTNIIRPNSVVYDLGANNGLHSLLFAHLAGPSGKVFSFEPLKTNCKEIAENASLNNLKNIEIVEAAVGNESKQVTFHLGHHDKQGSLVGIGSETGADITVKMITLDDFIASGKPRPDFIKIDVEGAESLALEGFDKTIDEIKPVIYIELHTPEQDTKVGNFMQRHNYLVYRQKTGANSNDLGLEDLEPIKDLTKPFQHPDGIWGTILAVHSSKVSKLG